MKTVRIGIKLTDKSARVASALQNPNTWAAYRAHMLRLVTEGAKATIQRYASTLWKKPTGQLDSSWFTKYSEHNSTGMIYNTKSYAYWLNFGVRPHQMTYLLNDKVKTYQAWGKYPYEGKVPVPINSSDGLLFRRVTAEGMRAGKWMHPGYSPYNFVGYGMLEYERTEMPREIEGLLFETVKNV
jgi:hypothetical protein